MIMNWKNANGMLLPIFFFDMGFPVILSISDSLIRCNTMLSFRLLIFWSWSLHFVIERVCTRNIITDNYSS